MSKPPVVIPLGAMRFNSDSQRLEYFNGDIWMQIHTFSTVPLDGGHRGLFAGGGTPSYLNAIDYITISTAGNSQDFGDLHDAHMCGGAGSSNVRGLFAGGGNPGRKNEIDMVTIASTGNASDFGDLTVNRSQAAGNSNQTRFVLALSLIHI